MGSVLLHHPMHKNTVVYYIDILYHAKAAFLAKIPFILVITFMRMLVSICQPCSQKENPLHDTSPTRSMLCPKIRSAIVLGGARSRRYIAARHDTSVRVVHPLASSTVVRRTIPPDADMTSWPFSLSATFGSAHLSSPLRYPAR